MGVLPSHHELPAKGQGLSDSEFTVSREGSCQVMQKCGCASAVPAPASISSSTEALLACKMLASFLKLLVFFFCKHLYYGIPYPIGKSYCEIGGLHECGLFAHLLSITFPDGLRLGRCAGPASAGTPPAVHLLCPSISFPRSTLCRIYSSGVERCLYTCQLQRCITTYSNSDGRETELKAACLHFPRDGSFSPQQPTLQSST